MRFRSRFRANNHVKQATIVVYKLLHVLYSYSKIQVESTHACTATVEKSYITKYSNTQMLLN